MCCLPLSLTCTGRGEVLMILLSFLGCLQPEAEWFLSTEKQSNLLGELYRARRCFS